MGIPGFFNAMSKNYQMGISSSKIINSPSVYIDFNSLIYTAKYHVASILTTWIKYKLGLSYDKSIDLTPIPNSNLIDLSEPMTIVRVRDLMIFQTIEKLISNILIQTSNPIVHIYLDGVPFIGKMIEQRKRALLGSLLIRGKEIVEANTTGLSDIDKQFVGLEPFANLDKLSIKPGTEFMIKLEEWLSETFPDYTLNGCGTSGEAEHKIMNDIINHHDQGTLNIIVYSPDADMIVLLLPLTFTKQIYLIRDSIDKKVYDLSILRDDIINQFTQLIDKESRLSSLKLEEYRLLNDICFVYNIFGNDFLPKFDSINIYNRYTISNVLTQYIKYLNTEIKYKKIEDVFLITDKKTVNWKCYSVWLSMLAKKYDSPIPEKIQESTQTNNLNPTSYVDQIYSLNNFGKGFYAKEPDKFVWNKDIYSNTIYFEPNSSLDSIIIDYCIGILMIELLYNTIYKRQLSEEEKQIVELWYYPHHKAPLIQDVAKWLDENHKNIKQLIRNHLQTRMEHFPKLFKPNYVFQLYYITPFYDDFLKLVGSSYKKKYPKLQQHFIYEEYINQLVWDKDKSKLNLMDLLDCNAQRFIDKCIPLLKSKLNNNWINLVFDPVDWIK